MIPEHRLASLLHQVKQAQISKCLYHNTANSPSLYSDHSCPRDQFPLATIEILTDHSDEVWFLQFSHDGTRLASASQDFSVIVWDTQVGKYNCFCIGHCLVTKWIVDMGTNTYTSGTSKRCHLCSMVPRRFQIIDSYRREEGHDLGFKCVYFLLGLFPQYPLLIDLIVWAMHTYG